MSDNRAMKIMGGVFGLKVANLTCESGHFNLDSTLSSNDSEQIVI